MVNDESHSKIVARACDRIRSNDPSFTSLHLPFKLTGDDVSALISALRRGRENDPPHLESLNLKHNTKTDPDLTRSLVETALPRIKNLSMSHMKLTDEQAHWIGQALKEGSTRSSLKGLVLRRNAIGCKGAQSLAEGLRGNTSLERLDLAENKIDSAGCRVLASSSSGLKYLDLSCNRIGDAGADAIARGLLVGSSSSCCSSGTSCSLTHISLNSNKISDSGIQSLAWGLRRNSSLTELSLYNNAFTGTGGVPKLEASLQTTNYNMEMIYFDWNDRISIAQRDRIRDCCRRNAQTKRIAGRVEKESFEMPLGLWPRALELVQSKPDLLYAALKSKPELMRGGGRASKKSATRAADSTCSCSIL